MNTSPPPESSSRSAAAPTRTTPGTIVIGSTCWAVMTPMIAEPQTPRPSCVYYCTLRTLAPAIQHTKVHVKALDARLGALPCQESWSRTTRVRRRSRRPRSRRSHPQRARRTGWSGTVGRCPSICPAVGRSRCTEATSPPQSASLCGAIEGTGRHSELRRTKDRATDSTLPTNSGETVVPGEPGRIAQAILDTTTGALVTVRQRVWQGTGGKYPECPHVYRIRDLWYQLI